MYRKIKVTYINVDTSHRSQIDIQLKTEFADWVERNDIGISIEEVGYDVDVYFHQGTTYPRPSHPPFHSEFLKQIARADAVESACYEATGKYKEAA